MRLFLLAVLVAVLSGLSACESPEQKDERLARRYCGSCHVFPEPALLDKKTWQHHILPQMAFRMGFRDMSQVLRMSEADRAIILASVPSEKMVSTEEFDMIRRFYLTHAPDSLLPTTPLPATPLTLFDVSAIRLPGNEFPNTTLVHIDTTYHQIFVGTRSSKLYRFDTVFALEDSTVLPSTPAHIIPDAAGGGLITCMGIMDPNEQSRGAIIQLGASRLAALPYIDSLQRPVYLEKVDLNGDSAADYIVCEFGNYTGMLSAFEQEPGGRLRKHVLLPFPGARKVIVRDVDNNGLPDILCLMAQGDERIVLLSNHGGFKFRLTTVLRFPPVYGSSYFDVVDFNHDGKFDIICTHGDNLDYSMILKPYHGIRLYQNDGRNQFSETTFLPMDGAYQTSVHDFDGDGDLDIAAIAFFPDFKNTPQKGFLYFENVKGQFKAKEIPEAASGRWITMDAADVDQDGDTDIVLGAMGFNSGVPDSQFSAWTHNPVSLLYLHNKTR